MSWYQDLLADVDATFATTGRGHATWPDPHPDRMPAADPAGWTELAGAAWSTG